MGPRIVRLALVAAVVALVLFGLPLALGLGQFLATEKRASLQLPVDFAARSVQEDMAHDRVPARSPDRPADAAVALYDEDGELLLGDGPARGDGPVDRALSRGFLAVPSGQLVVAAPISDTHDVVGVVRVAAPPSSVTRGCSRSGLGMAALAGLVLLVAWLLGRRLVLCLTPPRTARCAAGRLGDGDFGARADPTGIREVDLVGTALGDTARRLDHLLARERAFSAEASHQLRTPFAGLRLRLESTLDRPDRLTRETVEDGLASIDRLERTIDELLQLAREHPVPADGSTGTAVQRGRGRMARPSRRGGPRVHHLAAAEPSRPSGGRGGRPANRRGLAGQRLPTRFRRGLARRARAGPTAIALEVSDDGPGIPEGALTGSRHGGHDRAWRSRAGSPKPKAAG